MRACTARSPRTTDLRRQLERLGGLPLRPRTARDVLAPALGGNDPSRADPSVSASPLAAGIDPGWSLARLLGRGDPLVVIADTRWWPPLAGAPREAVHRLWRHAVAARCAASRLAAESGRPDAEADHLGRVALLHALGYWAVAAVAPDLLADWLALADPDRRREAEHAALGSDAATLGRDLAELWGADDLLADVAWLHAEAHTDWSGCVADPDTLALVQRAHAWAERTPWALHRAADGDLFGPPSGPRVRLLVAEVQVLCSGAFVPADVSSHEEPLARAHARLLREHVRLGRLARERGRVLALVAQADPPPPDDPGVAPPSDEPSDPLAWQARRAWLSLRDRFGRLRGRLDTAREALRRRVEHDERHRGRDQLDALAEFAAGAAHELNNPLAVVVGRAQLLLSRWADPESSRSLRAIIAQAQRAHRILRDLMYVARPPAPRPRRCQPDGIARACLDDLRGEADARGVRLVCETPTPPAWAWADPDPLRHLIEALARNALEATPPGGTVRVSTSSTAGEVRWRVHDDGRGLDPKAARCLLNPFYCGREAGRGLGLGLPRAARFVALIGGTLRWRSAPGRGTVFQLTLPLEPPPTEPAPAPTRAASRPPSTDGAGRGLPAVPAAAPID